MRDDRREIERYKREPLANQVLGELQNLRNHPKVLLLLGVIVGGWLVLHVLEPQVVRLEDLRTGDCIYIPSPTSGGADSPRPIGTSTDAELGLVQAGAERAPCDGQHSHEVAAVFMFPDKVGADHPGSADLSARQQATCTSAFESYIGHAVSGSRYDLTVVVPTKKAWDAGRRAGACLVSSADGHFMGSRAGGNGG
jgi:hypothetical protein